MDVMEDEGNELRLNMIESIDSFVDWIVSRHFARLRHERNLLVTNEADVLPTIIEIEERECPNGGDSNILEEIPEGTTCFDMSSIVTIYVEKENKNIITLEFEQHIFNSLAERELQVIAKAIDNDIVFVNTKQNTPFPPDSPTLSAGELAGIGAAGFVVGFALIGGMFIQSRRRRFGKRAQDLEDFDDEMMQDTESGGRKNKSRSQETLGMPEQQMGIGVQQISDSGSYSTSDRSFSSSYESSNAGSSGWSSGGVSSMNASSVDSFDADRVQTHGATLATIGLASGITNNLLGQTGPRAFNTRTISNNTRTTTSDGDTLSTKSDHNVVGNFGVEGSVPNMPSVSRNDLDAAIQAGDWAAVGATAALLANAASDTNSVSTRSYNSKRSTNSSSMRSNSNSAMSSVDANRAAELDHLVDTGDWEGVVLAASKFEAASDKGSSNSAISLSSEDIQSFTNSYSSINTKDSGLGTNVGTSTSRSVSSETWSKTQKRDEIRSEVEALVKRVVPDEINNVDEMMLQFRGREEELLETLRTMQERSIAQKARAAGQKSAKRDAKSKRLGAFQAAPRTAASMTSTISTKPSIDVDVGGGKGLGAILAGIAGVKSKKQVVLSIDSRSISSQGANSLSSASKKQSALDKAIDSGDWEAVGEAAAMMSDTDSDRYGSDTGSFSSSGGTGTTDSSGAFNIRGSDLDMLIDSGNWQGVVDAASKYGESTTAKTKKSDTSSTGRKLFGKREKSDSDSSDTDTNSASSSSFGRMWKARKKKQNKNKTGGLFGKKPKVVEKTADKKVTKDSKEDVATQADLWMEIAAQSKQEGSAQGASDAADWAISRSLSALLKTEDKPPGSKASIDSSKGDES